LLLTGYPSDGGGRTMIRERCGPNQRPLARRLAAVVTGQNPQSGAAVAEKVLTILE
jgi:hypothetical protein